MAKLKCITRISHKRNPEKGERGAISRITDWAEGVVYCSGASGETFVDIVYYGGLYYRCTTTHTSTSNTNPYTSIQAGSKLWTTESNFALIATKVAFVGEGADGWIIENGQMTHTSGKLAITKDGCIRASNGNFEVDSEGNIYAKSGTFEGFMRTNFEGFTAGAKKISNGVFEVSDKFNLIADGAYGYEVLLRLPTDAKYIGAVLNVYDHPIKTRSSPILSIEGVMLWSGSLSSTFGGFDPISKITAPNGGLIQLIGVPLVGECAWMISTLQMPAAYMNDDYTMIV